MCPGWGLGPSCRPQVRIPGLSPEGLPQLCPLHPCRDVALPGRCPWILSGHPTVLSRALASSAANEAGGCATPRGGSGGAARQVTAGLSPAQPRGPGDTRDPGDTRGPGHVQSSVILSQEQSPMEGGVLPRMPVTGTLGVVAVGEQSHWCAPHCVQRKRGRRGSLMPPGRKDNEDDNRFYPHSWKKRKVIGWRKGSIPATNVPQMLCGAAPADRDELGSVMSLQRVPWGIVTVTTQLAGSEQWRGLLVTNGTRREDGRRSQGCSWGAALCSPFGAGSVPVGARRQRVSQLCGGGQEGGDTLGGEGDSVAKSAKASPKVAPAGSPSRGLLPTAGPGRELGTKSL